MKPEVDFEEPKERKWKPNLFHSTIPAKLNQRCRKRIMKEGVQFRNLMTYFFFAIFLLEIQS